MRQKQSGQPAQRPGPSAWREAPSSAAPRPAAPPPAAVPLLPGQLLDVQRSAGNAAASRLRAAVPAVPTVQRDPPPPPGGPLVLGGTPRTSETVRLYHYGNLDGLTSFTSKPGYPRLTDCDIASSQAEAAQYTGAPVSPNLRYKYELVIDQEYFDANFRNTGSRKGYSEYGTAKPIDIKYFRRIATLTVTPPTSGGSPSGGGALPPAGGGSMPPVSGTGGSSTQSSQEEEEEGGGTRQSKWGMSPGFSAQLFGRGVNLALSAIQTWALLNLERENQEKSAADRKSIETLVNYRLESQSDKVVNWWADYEPGVYVTITTQTTYEEFGWLNQNNMPSTATRYGSAWLVDVQVATTLGENARRVRVLATSTENNAVHSVLLVTDTSSVLLPLDEGLLRNRLGQRIEELDAQLAAVSEPDRLSLRLERDRLVRRLQLLGS